MIWSNWQTAIGRGAVLTLLMWAGLAWTQTPVQPPASNGNERIMVVHENGRSTRCRVVESWLEPDRRTAHLLQALDTAEFITIIDEKIHTGPTEGARGMPKRIFAWGVGRQIPPDGSPMPPQRGPGFSINNDTPTPPIVLTGGTEKPQNMTFNPGAEKISTLAFPTVPQPNKDQAVDFGNRAPGLASPVAGPRPIQQVEFVNRAPGLTTPVATQNLVIDQPPPKQSMTFPRLNALLSAFSPERTPSAPSTVVPQPSAPTIVQPAPAPTIAQPSPMPVGPRNVFPANNPTSAQANSGVPPFNPGAIEPNGAPPRPSTQFDPNPVAPGTPVDPRSFSQTPAPKPANKWQLGNAFKKPDPLTPNVAQNPAVGTPFTPAPPPGVLPPPPPGNAAAPTKAPYSGILGLGNKPTPQNLAITQPAPTPPGGLSTPVAPPSTLANTGPFTPPFPGLQSTPVNNPAIQSAPPTPLGEPSLTKSSPTAPTPATTPSKAAADADQKKSWRPGDKLQVWLKGSPTTPTTPETKPSATVAKGLPKDADQRADDLLNNQNKIAQRQLEQRVEQIYKVPFSTAMSNTPLPNTPKADAKKPDTTDPALPGAPSIDKTAVAPPVGPPPFVPNDLKDIPPPPEVREMWGTNPPSSVLPPGKSVLDPPLKPMEIVKLPAPPERRNDPLMNPERLTPASMKAPAVAEPRPMAKVEEPKGPPPFTEPSWPLNSQSALAARSGLQGPVVYVPVPIVTQPYPNQPPAPPAPMLPSPPELNLYVNAFSPPPGPKATVGSPQTPAMMNAFVSPAYAQQMMMQQQLIQQQQMLLAQQQMLSHQQMTGMGNPMMPYMTPTNPMQAQYRMPSTGPMNNFSRSYTGPMPPNPAMQVNYQPMPYPPMQPAMQPMMQPVMQPSYGMMPQQPLQPVGYQQPAAGPQLDQLLRVLRESPHPVQREWAAQSLTGFDWRVCPHIIPALLTSATSDPAGSVRARSVSCLGRIGAAVEPVFGTLQSLRNDIDPRVRQEVEQAFVALGQMPMMPQ